MLILPGCQAQSRSHPYSSWGPAHVRALDPADTEAAQDILAVYTQREDGGWRLRLDFMDTLPSVDSDLYLLLDTVPGGTRELPIQAQAQLDWDLLVRILASGEIRVEDSDLQAVDGFPILVLRDPNLDTIEIWLGPGRAPFPSQGFRFQVILTAPGSAPAVEITGAVDASGRPVQRLPVLLAFWNTMPAYTPAQALRRWDGAHTGPLGGRHGLLHLLRAARNTHTPLALLDLKAPASLAAVDLLDGLDLVRDLSARNLLVAPDPLPGYPGFEPSFSEPLLAQMAAENRQAASAFDLPARSPFLFSPTPQTPASPGSEVIFYAQEGVEAASGLALVEVRRVGARLAIPIPGYTEGRLPQPGSVEQGWVEQGWVEQASLNGPTPELRRALIEAARQVNAPGSINSEILILGGDLPRSHWGIPSHVGPTLHYLASRPWLQVLNGYDLLTMAGGAGGPLFALASKGSAGADFEPPSEADEAAQETLERRFQVSRLQVSAGSQAAWDAYLALFAPTWPAPPDLQALRANYLPQVHGLLSAAEWAQTGAGRSGCQEDPDWDGEPECRLISSDIYAQFENEDGRLVLLFARVDGHVHQLAGPASQLSTGLSDPQSWDLSAGLTADPAVLPGAFSEFSRPEAARPFSPVLEGDLLRFTSADEQVEKLYRLIPGGIRFEYQGEEPASFEIPLLLDPWLRFQAGWPDFYGFRGPAGAESWSAAAPQQGGVRVNVYTSGELAWRTFKDSVDFLDQAENPDRNYAPGHYVEFPLAVAEVTGGPVLTVEIQARPLSIPTEVGPQ